MLVSLLLMAVGLGLLVAGAEGLVRGASRLALGLGVPAVVIGLTVVAYGTSCPELAVSLIASLAGQDDIAVGNIVGSNIFNVLLILGVSALIVPLTVHRQIVRLDVPVMVGVALLLPVVGWGGRVGRVEGLVLLALGVAYTAMLVRMARRTPAGETDTDDDLPKTPGRWWANVMWIAGGIALLVLGSRWLVQGAIVIAKAAGVSELVIGLTIIAAGTSLPEVATSIVAALRGQRDIAVGNVVGSNIFNILFVLGGAAALAPRGMSVSPQVLQFDIPIMIAVSVACLPVFFSGRRIDRWEGGLFLGWYVAYTALIVLLARRHHWTDELMLALLVFALPLTLLTLAVIFIQERRRANG